MSFKADPASLDEFATVLDGLGDDVKAARDYLLLAQVDRSADASPSAALVAPTSEQMIPETFDKILSFPDYFSLGHWVLVGCDALFGVNPPSGSPRRSPATGRPSREQAAH